MKVGGKAKLVCPSNMAYGDRGEPRAGIPGGAALVFEVELLDIIAPPAAVSMTPEAQAPAAAPAQTPPNPKDSSKP
jgi:FKBP-type peptidyl-prolyl cis-trans isomerase FkpA